MSQRQSARKFNISQQRVCKLLQNNGICARKKKKIPSRTEQQKTVAKAKCANLYLKNQGFPNPEKTLNGHNSIIFKYYEKEKKKVLKQILSSFYLY